ncbi:MAG: chemotaxis protein CheX [Phycisphaeraceae bacterium]|nr:chemotaxis protein CheX [Phycisphaeraceae bacterium]
MQHDQSEIIEQVATEVLEQLAFMFADPATPDELPETITEAYVAQIGIRGAATGKLTVVAGHEICAELTANITGEEADEVSIESAVMAIGELTNVLCGQMLTQIAGTDPVFDLEPPAILDHPQDHWGALVNDPNAVALLVDDCPMVVLLELKMDSAQAA